MNKLKKGIVKYFFKEKGFGIICCNELNIFVHFSDIIKNGIKTLEKGDYVTFKIIEHKKGKQAVEVVPEK